MTNPNYEYARAPEAATEPKPKPIECNTTELMKALALISKALPKRPNIPALSHVLVERDGDWVSVTATDLDVRASVRINCEARISKGGNTRNGSFLMPWPGKALAAMPETIIVETDPKDSRVNFFDEIGASSLSFETMDPAYFPISRFSPDYVPAPRTQASWSVDAGELRRLIDEGSHAISNEEARFYLNGMYFHAESDGALRAVTTDGHRMVINQAPAPGLTMAHLPVIVPRLALAVVRGYCRTVNAGFAVTVTTGDTGIIFDFGLGKIVESRRIDGTFPDYKHVLKTAGGDKLVAFDRKALIAALSKFPMKRSTDDRRGVNFTLKAGTCTLSRPAVEGHSGMTHAVPRQYDGPDLETCYNPGLLLDACRSLDGDQIGFSFDDAGSPCLIMASEYPQIVVMPMRRL